MQFVYFISAESSLTLKGCLSCKINQLAESHTHPNILVSAHVSKFRQNHVLTRIPGSLTGHLDGTYLDFDGRISGLIVCMFPQQSLAWRSDRKKQGIPRLASTFKQL